MKTYLLQESVANGERDLERECLQVYLRRWKISVNLWWFCKDYNVSFFDYFLIQSIMSVFLDSNKLYVEIEFNSYSYLFSQKCIFKIYSNHKKIDSKSTHNILLLKMTISLWFCLCVLSIFCIVKFSLSPNVLHFFFVFSAWCLICFCLFT